MDMKGLLKITLARGHAAMTRRAVLWKTEQSRFLQGLNSKNHSFFQYRTTLLVWELNADCRSERRSQAVENNTTGGRLAYNAESIKRTNTHANRHYKFLLSVLLSIVNRRKISWFGQVCRHDTLPQNHATENITFQSSQRKSTWIMEGQKSISLQASHCCRSCCASRTTEIDGLPLKRRRLSDLVVTSVS